MIEQEMNTQLAKINLASPIADPDVAFNNAAGFLIHLNRIHPMQDGNGRMSTLLTEKYLQKILPVAIFGEQLRLEIPRADSRRMIGLITAWFTAREEDRPQMIINLAQFLHGKVEAARTIPIQI